MQTDLEAVAQGSLKVSDVLIRVFPNGTVKLQSGNKRWDHVPVMPPDVFGFCAYLLELSGLYSRFDPSSPHRGCFNLTPETVDKLKKIGQVWRSDAHIDSAPHGVLSRWKTLSSNDECVYDTSDINSWCVSALELLIIADEACADVGFGWTRQFDEILSTSWIIERYLQNFAMNELGDSAFFSLQNIPYTLCLMADPDVLCVQPKTRTPTVGVSMRNFSHNLTLLPPRGSVKISWVNHIGGVVPVEKNDELNLLLIPFPYYLKAKQIKQKEVLSIAESDDTDSPHFNHQPYGSFEIGQSWLKEEGERDDDDGVFSKLFGLVEALLEEAQGDCRQIHGIIFPEYSLKATLFERLVQKLAGAFTSLQFIVSGSSDLYTQADKIIPGNSVLTAMIQRQNKKRISRTGDIENTIEPVIITTARKKHHRWRMDAWQINNYALSAVLDPKMIWWESLSLDRRELYINTFRDSSTFTALICEDLARTEPVHATLKSIGPNIVFALLMDGPQTTDRWSARHALSLTEDPGSSVLTMTSLALVERSNLRKAGGSRSIALWRDDTGKAIELECPQGCLGILLNLAGHKVNELTIDRRKNSDAMAWRYAGYMPLKIRKPSNKMRKILEWADPYNR